MSTSQYTKVELAGDGNQTTEEDRSRGFSLMSKLKNIERAISDGPDKKYADQAYAKWPGDHPYSYTIGDVEYRDVPDIKTGKTVRRMFALTEWPKAKESELIIPKSKVEEKTEKKDDKKDKKKKKNKEPKPLRKIFVSFKVKRVSDIDNIEQEFRAKFHIYFNWLPTYKEYMSFIEEKEKGDIYKWEPRWYPHLEFMNQIDPIEPYPRWEAYPDEGRFRMQHLKGFFENLCDDPKIYDPRDRKTPYSERKSIGTFAWKDAVFIRAKYDVEMVLSEELELQSFPFDCQDLSIIMRENTRDVHISFLPEMRKTNFGSVDPRYSVIDEWDLESARIEFGATNAGSSRSSTAYPMIIIRLKVKRRWQVFMWNIVLLVLCIECLAITAFSLDIATEAADRLGLSITLVLTAVAFLHIVKSGLPNVPYLTFLDFYVLSSYVFLMAIMLETAFLSTLDDIQDAWDRRFMFACIGYQILYHIFFFSYSFYVRRQETLKLVMDSDSIEEEVNQSRPALTFDFTKGRRQGDKDRLLYFRAEQKKEKPKTEEKKKDDNSKKTEEKKPLKEEKEEKKFAE